MTVNCHRWFLPTDHNYKNKKKDIFIGRVERDVSPPLLSSEELYDIVSEYDNIVFGFQCRKQMFSGFDLNHN
jgi:hypothetical protein